MSEGRYIQRRHRIDSPSRYRMQPPPTGHRSGDEPEDGSDFRKYLEILVRRKKLAVGIFLVVVVGVLLGTLLQPRIYRATGLLEIRNQGGGDGAATQEALFSSENVNETSMRTQYELLRSAALARLVIRDLELYRLEGFGSADGERRPVEVEGATGGGLDVSAADLQGAVRAFRSRLIVDPKVDSRLVEVSFDHEDPELAARAANAVLTSYVDMRAGTGLDAATWLDAQMDSVRADLEASEQSLQRYAQANGLPYMVDDDVSGEIRDRVRRLEDEIAEAETSRYEKESLYNLVVQQGQFEAVDDRVVEELSIRLSDLRREYARLSSTFTDDYPQTREVRSQLQSVESQLAQERQRIVRKMQNDYEVAVRNEEMLRQALEEERTAADALAQRSGPYHLLRREVLANRELYAALQQTRKQVQVGAALEATGVAIVDRAVPPEFPHRPQTGYNMALAIMTGLLLGVAGALLREYFDNTVRTEYEVGRAADLPVLAMIPSFDPLRTTNGDRRPRLGAGRRLLPGRDRDKGDGIDGADSWARIDRAHEADDGYQAIVEAFGTLRTAMLFKSDGLPPRSLLVSSCQPGDGKTTVSLNLALSLMRLDRRILLVDGDLRRPCLHRALGIPRVPGLSDHLATGKEWRSMVRVAEATGLHVLTAGLPRENPADLFSQSRMEVLIGEAEESYDFVVLDAPALFVNVPDARLLAQMVAGVVVVVRSGTTPRSLLGRILEAAPNVLGVIVNDLNPENFPDYYREYSASVIEEVHDADDEYEENTMNTGEGVAVGGRGRKSDSRRG